jgi:calicheamicin 4-deoxy-4-thio-alpha-D-digitoxosyltransferase
VETFDDRYAFVGPCLTERAHQGEWQPPGIGPMLWISLGTAFNERTDFFRTCAEAFAGTPWQVVMSIGTLDDPVELGGTARQRDCPPARRGQHKIPIWR